jgi:hypothetical protein
MLFHLSDSFPTIPLLTDRHPNPDNPEAKLKDKTQKDMQKILSGNRELTKVNKISPDFLSPSF